MQPEELSPNGIDRLLKGEAVILQIFNTKMKPVSGKMANVDMITYFYLYAGHVSAMATLMWKTFICFLPTSHTLIENSMLSKLNWLMAVYAKFKRVYSV